MPREETRDSCAFSALINMQEKLFIFTEVIMAEEKLNRDNCIALLQGKYALLQEQGIDRYPKRSDFSEREVVAVKAFLGPWPRALEAAGIKPPRDDDRNMRNKEKRIRAKRRRTMARKDAKKLSKERNGY